MPSIVKINSESLKGLLDKGINPKTIELLEGARKTGAIFRNRADLQRIGITIDEIDKIATSSSFADPEPEKIMKTAIIGTDINNTSGYFLLVKYQNKETLEIVEDLYPVNVDNLTKIEYDDKVASEVFRISVKNPTGDFATIELGTTKAIHLNVKKTTLEGIKVKVHPLKPVATLPNKIQQSSKLTGRLLSNNVSRKLEGIQIVVEIALGKDNTGNPIFSPVCYAETESQGYFFTSQPQFLNEGDMEKIIQARARIGLKEIDPVDIRLINIDSRTGKGKLPEKLILFIEEKKIADGEETECGCNELNFHTKKVLDEFSFYSVVRTTEPSIESMSIQEVESIDLAQIVDDVEIIKAIGDTKLPPKFVKDFITKKGAITKDNYMSLLSAGIKYSQEKKIKDQLSKDTKVILQQKGRLNLDGTNLVDWDDKPTVYQATSIAHGHLLQFKQEWFNDGYSLGDILYSLPLAPGQKKQIVVFDWDRKDSAARVEQLDYQDSLYNSLSRDRDINEVAKATVREHLEGESSATTMGAAAGAGGFAGPVLIGGGAGIGHSFSSASQDSSRSTTGRSRQHIIDKTVQAANSIRSQRSTVIQTVSQGERFEVSAEVIANYNHCHAMTIQYFEVLRHFEIRTRLAHVQECLFIPLQMTPFDRKKALRWRDTLIKVLKERSLVKGFNALERYDDAIDKCGEGNNECVDRHYDELGFPDDSYSKDELEYIEGELYIEFDIKRPRNGDEDEFDESKWNHYGFILGDPKEFYDTYIKHEKRKDDAFAKHAGPKVVHEFMNRIKMYAIDKNGNGTLLPIDFSLMSNFKNKTRLNISLRMNGSFNNLRREDISFVSITIKEPNATKKELLNALIDESLRITVHGGSMRYRTRNLHEELFNNKSIKNDLTVDGDDVRIFTPLSSRALKRPRLEDVELMNSLLHHLNENIEYYHQWLWIKMNPQRRFMLLDGLIAPGKAQGRSVASVVENRLIGIAGNCLIMPVAAGFQLDPTLDDSIDLFEHYYENPRDPIHVSLPTKGVFAEAVMGSCNSCEKIDNSRFWKWEDSPIPDSPTTINPVNLPTPQNIQPPNLQAKDFTQPIINLQNAPTLPDPQGLGALINLLGNGNLFKDITGLNENQKNALASLQAAFSTATAFGNQAAAIAPLLMKQQALDQIRTAKENGLLSDEQASKLTEQTFDSIINSTDGKTKTDTFNKIKGLDNLVKDGVIKDIPTLNKINDVKSKLIDNLGDDGSKGKNNAIENFINEAANSSGSSLKAQLEDGFIEVQKNDEEDEFDDSFDDDPTNIELENTPIFYKTSKNISDDETEVALFIFDFEINSSELTPPQKALLTSFVEELLEPFEVGTDSAVVKINDVIGRTSEPGNERANLKLGLKRANEVIRFLLDAGVPLDSLPVPRTEGERNSFVAAFGSENSFNRNVEIRYSIIHNKLPVVEPTTDPTASKKWKLDLQLDLSGGELLGALLQLGFLTNLKTGVTKPVKVFVGGLDVSIGFPIAVDINIASTSDGTFELTEAVTFDYFNEQFVLLAEASAGALFGATAGVITIGAPTKVVIESVTFDLAIKLSAGGAVMAGILIVG